MCVLDLGSADFLVGTAGFLYDWFGREMFACVVDTRSFSDLLTLQHVVLCSLSPGIMNKLYLDGFIGNGDNFGLTSLMIGLHLCRCAKGECYVKFACVN